MCRIHPRFPIAVVSEVFATMILLILSILTNGCLLLAVTLPTGTKQSEIDVEALGL